MSQQCCPWCGHCGPRYDDGTPRADIPGAHSDGSKCVCRHVNAGSRLAALEVGGRYFDRKRNKWVCPSCGTAPGASLWEIEELERRAELADT